jgi:hypothetical protein
MISGAEQSIQKYWNLDKFQHGLTVAIALIGTVIAPGGWYSCRQAGTEDYSAAIAALLFLPSAQRSPRTGMYSCCSELLGLGVGASSVTAPIYFQK